jgi:hypothetical protein
MEAVMFIYVPVLEYREILLQIFQEGNDVLKPEDRLEELGT